MISVLLRFVDGGDQERDNDSDFIEVEAVGANEVGKRAVDDREVMRLVPTGAPHGMEMVVPFAGAKHGNFISRCMRDCKNNLSK
jgi:hypothetical protein